MRVRSYNITFVLISFVFLSNFFQYFTVSVESLLYSNSFYFQIDKEFAAGMFSKYLKDIAFVIFGLVYPYFVYVNMDMLYQRSWLVPLGVFCFVVLSSVLGHLYSQDFYHLISGFRWLLNLYVSIGVFVVSLILMKLDFNKYIKTISLILWFILFFSFVFAFLQWTKTGFGSFGGMRLNANYANSGVFGFVIVGLSLFYFSFREATRYKNIYILILLFFMAVLSGTRTAMLCILILIYWEFVIGWLVGGSSRAIFAVLLTSSFLFIIGAYFGVLVVDDIAGRGELFNNFDAGNQGRMYLFKAVMASMFDNSAGVYFFGQGLGFGTNLSVILNLSGGTGILDSTIATWFAQFGLFGLLSFSIFLIMFLYKYTYLITTCRYLSFRLVIVFAVIFIVGLNQNFFENYFFLPITGLVLSIYIFKQLDGNV
jgi:hypothetical protein